MKDSFYAEYSSKLIEKEQALKLVREGDRIMCHGGASSFMALLDENIDNLSGIELYTMFLLTRPYSFLDNSKCKNIRHFATFVSPYVREQLRLGNAPEIILTHYSDTDDFVRYRARPTILFCQVTPMDEEGYFTMGYNSLGHRVAAEMADRVIVQVNRNLPKIAGECNRLHIGEVTAIYEEDTPVHTSIPQPHTELDTKAAGFVAERICDGATLQIGVGRVPDAIGPLLRDHRNLGVHTELFSQSLMELMKAGVINNSKKTLLPGKAVFSFAGGQRATQEIYDFVDRNSDIEMRPISWVNDPRIIAQHDNFVSVNSALAVDLTGQVCSETIGLRTFSGPGGQLDFVRGARWSKGGKSFIVINSTTEGKDGNRLSKIDVALPLSSAVTTPRADVDCIERTENAWPRWPGHRSGRGDTVQRLPERRQVSRGHAFLRCRAPRQRRDGIWPFIRQACQGEEYVLSSRLPRHL